MKTAKLKNGLICVSVPMDATDFYVSLTYTKFITYQKDNHYYSVELPFRTFDNYQILGTITASGFEGDLVNILGDGIPHNNFKISIENQTDFLFENNKPHPSDINPTSKRHYDKIAEEWEQAQSRVIEKLLILKTI